MEVYYYFHLPQQLDAKRDAQQRSARVLVMRIDGRYWSATLVVQGASDVGRHFTDCWRPSQEVPLLDYMGTTERGETYVGIHLNHIQYLQHFPGRITPSVDALVSWIRQYAAALAPL